MIQDFHIADAPRLFELLQTNFPEEERAYGTRPESWAEAIRRIHRPTIRFLVALARLARRPIYRFFTIQEDGRLVATSLVSFAPRIGYISTVMVDGGYRRRGYARRLLARCHEEIARFHRPNAVLDVLTDNAPARALYLSDGYRMLRSSTLYAMALPAGPGGPGPAGEGRVRPYRSADHRTLARVADAAVPAEIAKVLPSPGRRLASSKTIDQVLGAETAAWVLEVDGRPVVWVSATSSRFMEAASLATPIVAPGADAPGVMAMLSTAVAWCGSHHAARILCRVPDDNVESVRALTAHGFAATLTADTLVRPLP